MTQTAKSLLKYVMHFGGKNQDEAIAYLDEYARPDWRDGQSLPDNDD